MPICDRPADQRGQAEAHVTAGVNKAVEANLRKVLAEAQTASALRMAWVRLILATIAVGVAWWPSQLNAARLGPTRYGVLVLVLVSVRRCISDSAAVTCRALPWRRRRCK